MLRSTLGGIRWRASRRDCEHFENCGVRGQMTKQKLVCKNAGVVPITPKPCKGRFRIHVM